MTNQAKPDSAAPGGDVEQRARELLAAEYELMGYKALVAGVREFPFAALSDGDAAALRAITAALSDPKQVGVDDMAEAFATFGTRHSKSESLALHAVSKIDLDYKLPCEVAVAPATKISKGVPLRTLLAAITLRENGETFPADPPAEFRKLFTPQPAPQPVEAEGRESLFAQSYRLLAIAVSEAGFYINTENGAMYLTPKEGKPPEHSAEAEARMVALPMDTAPRDGTIVRLLVQFTDNGFEDVDPEKATWTIGQNGADHHPEDDEWLFAGWNWEQDCFTQGEGAPIGWLPMIDSPQPEQPAIDLDGYTLCPTSSLIRIADALDESGYEPSIVSELQGFIRVSPELIGHAKKLAIIDGAKGERT